MKPSEIATKADIERVVDLILNLSSQKPDGTPHIGFISFNELKEQTGMGDATIWRHEKAGNLKSYRLHGSTKKYYKLSEVKKAFESVQ